MLFKKKLYSLLLENILNVNVIVFITIEALKRLSNERRNDWFLSDLFELVSKKVELIFEIY